MGKKIKKMTKNVRPHLSYDENYAPPRRRNSRRDLTDYQPKSGTRLAYDYAVKKGKEIINVL